MRDITLWHYANGAIQRLPHEKADAGDKILPPGKSGSIRYFFKNSVGVITGTEEPAKSLIFRVRI